MTTTTAVSPAILRMCLHKKTYLSRKDAKTIARKTQNSYGDRRHKTGVYQCSNCGYWHVTSNIRKD